ncbi:ATP-binding protein, partial [Kitasatospora sp. RB6PN24]|uniref:ATP-binding protein n=1 Tax=Kitasatospora humi TaxID=2893891 RepID=UPI001E538107
RPVAPDKLVHVKLAWTHGLLRVEVHDAASDKLPAPVSAGVEDECGRGLLLVERLAREWGCGPRQGIGKMVWATIGPGS